MYAWIWRHLPFGLPGKIVGSLLLVTAVVALLWYKVFPAVEPILPFNDGQVTQQDGGPGAPVGPAGSGPSAPGAVPHSTNKLPPSPSR